MPCVLIMALSFMLMPLTHGFLAMVLVAMLMGFGNGIGSGIVMTLAADVSPAVGRLTFLGVWRELSDAGAGIGPVALSLTAASPAWVPAFSSAAASGWRRPPRSGHGFRDVRGTRSAARASARPDLPGALTSSEAP